MNPSHRKKLATRQTVFHTKNTRYFYRSASGDEPVREWLKALDKADRQAIGENIAYVQYKWPIGKPRVEHLRGSIWEVRSKPQ